MEKKTALIIGASRGLAIAKEFIAKNGSVVGTVRQKNGPVLHEIYSESPFAGEVSSLDIMISTPSFSFFCLAN
jgi:NAD(P)-dependent dehydrogenase (short-subunit alcohol dehydrogenase family)